MSQRTPSSLKWLIDKRSRLSGTLTRLDADRSELLERLQKLEATKARATRNLAAIDEALGLHEIQVMPSEIASVRPQRFERVFRYGDLTKQIVLVLKSTRDWTTTYAVTAGVLKELIRQGRAEKFSYEYVQKNVRRRLGKLTRLGIVERSVIASQGVFPESAWRLR